MANASINLADLNGNNGFIFNGIVANDALGTSVSGAGDVNGGRRQQTFLALNNSTAGFSASTDAVINITGYSGRLTDLAIG